MRLNLPWRRPQPEPGPIVLGSRRLYILPTRLGLVFGALLLGLLLASMNYGINLGYLFTFLLASIGVVGLLHTQRGLLGLRLTPLAAPPVFAGESARLALRIDNPGQRWRGGLRLATDTTQAEPLDLPPGGGGEAILTLPQPVRGWHRPGRLSLASTWPLGLFRCWTVFELDWGVLVYPKPAADALPWPDTPGAGLGVSTQRAGEDEFTGLRAYRPGDSPRRIAWKSVARDQAPLTKQFSGSGGRELWLDWSACPEHEPEARLSRLARWILDAEQAGLTWGLVLPGLRLPPGHGDRQRDRALEALARHG